MKKGIGMLLVLLLPVVWISGCDVVGENEPESTDVIEGVYSNIKDLPPAQGNLIGALTDSTGYETNSTDTTAQGGG